MPARLLPASALFSYQHHDGFSGRLLRAGLLVSYAVSRSATAHAELRYHGFEQGQFVPHHHVLPHEPLPAELLPRLEALLADPGFARLPTRYASGWDDLGSAVLVGRTPAGLVHGVEVEEPYGRRLSAGQLSPASPAEAALLALRDACAAWVQQLYGRVALGS